MNKKRRKVKPKSRKQPAVVKIKKTRKELSNSDKLSIYSICGTIIIVILIMIIKSIIKKGG
jgi:cell division protein FtsL